MSKIEAVVRRNVFSKTANFGYLVWDNCNAFRRSYSRRLVGTLLVFTTYGNTRAIEMSFE